MYICVLQTYNLEELTFKYLLQSKGTRFKVSVIVTAHLLDNTYKNKHWIRTTFTTTKSFNVKTFDKETRWSLILAKRKEK